MPILSPKLIGNPEHLCHARMLKEAKLHCEAGLPGMQFSIEGVSVFIRFIRVDHEGDESMCT
jgi:hypothetical protein